MKYLRFLFQGKFPYRFDRYFGFNLRSSSDPYCRAAGKSKAHLKTDNIVESIRDISPITKKPSRNSEYSNDKSFFPSPLNLEPKEKKFYEKPSPILKTDKTNWHSSDGFDKLKAAELEKELDRKEIESLMRENYSMKVTIEKLLLKNEQKNKTIKSLYQIVQIKENDFQDLNNTFKFTFEAISSSFSTIFDSFRKKISEKLNTLETKIKEFDIYRKKKVHISKIDELCQKITKFPIETLAINPSIIKFSNCLQEYLGIGNKKEIEISKTEISEIFSDSSQNKSLNRVFLIHKKRHLKYRSRIRAFINTISSQMQGFSLGNSFQLEFLISLKRHFDNFATIPSDNISLDESLERIDAIGKYIENSNDIISKNICKIERMSKNNESLNVKLNTRYMIGSGFKDRIQKNLESTIPEISYSKPLTHSVLEMIEKIDNEFVKLNTSFGENLVLVEETREISDSLLRNVRIDNKGEISRISDINEEIKNLHLTMNSLTEKFNLLNSLFKNSKSKEKELFTDFMNSLRNSKSLKKSKIEELKEKLNSKNEEISFLKEKIEILEGNYNNQQPKHNSSPSLGSEIFEDLKFQLVESQNRSIIRLKKKRTSTQLSLSNFQYEIFELKKEKASNLKTIEKLLSNLSSIFDAIDQFPVVDGRCSIIELDSVDEAYKKILNRNKKIHEMAKRFSTNNEILENLRCSMKMNFGLLKFIEAMEKKLEGTTNEINRLNGKISDISEIRSNQIMEEMSKLKLEIEKGSEEKVFISELQKEISTLKSQINSKSQKIKSLSQLFKTNLSIISSFQTQNFEYSNKLSKLYDFIAENNLEFELPLKKFEENICNSSIEVNNVICDKILQSTSNLESTIGDLQVYKNQFHTNFEKLKSRNEDLEAQICNLNLQINSLELENKEKSLLIQEKDTDLERTKILLEESKSRLEGFEVSFGDKDHFIKKLNDSLKERESHIENISAENSRINHELLTLKEMSKNRLLEKSDKIKSLKERFKNYIRGTFKEIELLQENLKKLDELKQDHILEKIENPSINNEKMKFIELCQMNQDKYQKFQEMMLVKISKTNLLYPNFESLKSLIEETKVYYHHQIQKFIEKNEDLNLQIEELSYSLISIKNEFAESVFEKELEFEKQKETVHSLNFKLSKQESNFEEKLEAQKLELYAILEKEIQALEKIKEEFESSIGPMESRYKKEISTLNSSIIKKDQEIEHLNEIIRMRKCN